MTANCYYTKYLSSCFVANVNPPLSSELNKDLHHHRHENSVLQHKIVQQRA